MVNAVLCNQIGPLVIHKDCAPFFLRVPIFAMADGSYKSGTCQNKFTNLLYNLSGQLVSTYLRISMEYKLQVAVYFIDGRGSCYRINLD